MSRIAPSYEEVLDALCAALPYIDRRTYSGDRIFWSCEAVAAKAGREVILPPIQENEER